jgi:hypothetical protein
MDTQRYRIKFSTNNPYVMPAFPLLRQTPGGKGNWDQFQFFFNGAIDECDAWFIYDDLSEPQKTLCPPENIVLITAEPPAFKSYPRSWLRQFKHVISCQRKLRHPNLHLSHMALPWFVKKTYDELAGSNFPQKTKDLSIICSNKRLMKWHRRRLAFIEALKTLKGVHIDFYGKGLENLDDKWDGLAPYRFSIALENSIYPDYWTEKIGDCFLAGTVPIYCGCPNISEYFPEQALEIIDITDVAGSLEKIPRFIARNDYKQRLPALCQAKNLILNRYNLFNLMTDFCQRLSLTARSAVVTLQPEPKPSRFVKNVRKWRRAYWGYRPWFTLVSQGRGTW